MNTTNITKNITNLLIDNNDNSNNDDSIILFIMIWKRRTHKREEKALLTGTNLLMKTFQENFADNQTETVDKEK